MNAATAALPLADTRVRIQAVLLCDLTGAEPSDHRCARAHAMLRECMRRHRGREIDHTEGFLLLFERPIEAVAFALDCQRELRLLADAPGAPLQARIGIHVGEVVLWDNVATDIADGAKPVEVEGLAKALAARLMGLARPGQTLLSETAHALAERSRSELAAEAVRWRGHGRYRVKGAPTPVPVYEVGEPGIAPLRAPPSTAKAWRLRPWWRTPIAQLAGVLAVLALLAAVLLQPTSAVAFSARDWVVVGSLRNLTTERVLDDGMQVALRAGLEQSRHVNVLSDLSVRAALRHMQRAPDAEIDRDVGAELAHREGARLLLLPTVAEIGGKVRVTIEIVDPDTRTTLVTESADGRGAESVLASMDRVVRRVRTRLNEPLVDIEGSSLPLPQVTTANLDALRAYALGRGEQAQGRTREAMALFEQAVRLDPGFDLARMAIVGMHLSVNELERAHARLREVDATGERLSTRERLYHDALSAWFEHDPGEALLRWQTFGRMYPDAFAAHANEAITASVYLADREHALQAMLRVDTPRNPLHRAAHMSLAEAHAGLGNLAEAEARLQRARDLGAAENMLVFALVPAAGGRHEQALAALRNAESTSAAVGTRTRELIHAAIELDLGDSAGALQRVREWAALAATIAERDRQVSELAEVGLLADLGHADWQPRLAAVVEAAAEDARHPLRLLHQEAVFRVLFAAHVAARHDVVDLARAALARVEGHAAIGAYPMLSLLERAVRAELARAEGEHALALSLTDSAEQRRRLFLLGAARMRALAAAGDVDAARAAADALVDARGLAWTESTYTRLTLLSNVVALAEAGRLAAVGERVGAR